MFQFANSLDLFFKKDRHVYSLEVAEADNLISSAKKLYIRVEESGMENYL